MQNKPNLPDAQMSVNSILTKDYERNDIFAVPENKPNPTQIKPIFKRMNVNFCATGYYESKPTFAVRKGRPNNPKVETTTAWSCGASPTLPLLCAGQVGQVSKHRPFGKLRAGLPKTVKHHPIKLSSFAGS